jgi:hypothetical protein
MWSTGMLRGTDTSAAAPQVIIIKGKSFSDPIDLSYRLFVPPRGVAIFEVSLRILYWIEDGNDDSLVLANFFDRIFCPWVQLEVLTPMATVPPLNIPL